MVNSAPGNNPVATPAFRIMTDAIGLAAILLLATTVQAGEAVHISWNSMDAGGTTTTASGGLQLGSTIGQPDAGEHRSVDFMLQGGFWAIVRAGSPTSTPLPSASPTATALPTATAPPPATATPSATVSSTSLPPSTPTRNASAAPTHTPAPTGPMPSPSATASATATRTGCVGDCGGDDAVTVDEIITMVSIALGNLPIAACEAGDRDGSGGITVDEIVAALSHALQGCRDSTSESSPLVLGLYPSILSIGTSPFYLPSACRGGTKGGGCAKGGMFAFRTSGQDLTKGKSS